MAAAAPQMKMKYLPDLVAASVQTVIGAWMFFGSHGIVGIRNVVREAGHNQVHGEYGKSTQTLRVIFRRSNNTCDTYRVRPRGRSLTAPVAGWPYRRPAPNCGANRSAATSPGHVMGIQRRRHGRHSLGRRRLRTAPEPFAEHFARQVIYGPSTLSRLRRSWSCGRSSTRFAERMGLLSFSESHVPAMRFRSEPCASPGMNESASTMYRPG